MGSLYLRGIPDALEAAVRALANADRRTTNAEAVVLLEEAVKSRADDMSPAQQQAIGLAVAP